MDDDELDEDMKLAIALSLQDVENKASPTATATKEKSENLCPFCNKEFQPVAMAQHQRWCESQLSKAVEKMEEEEKDFLLAKEIEQREREDNDPQIRRAKEKSAILDRYKQDDQRYTNRLAEFFSLKSSFSYTKVLDLSAFELTGEHVEQLLSLFSFLIHLEDIRLIFAGIADEELALLISCFPRTCKRVSIGGFVKAATPQTASALKLLIAEASITHLELALESFTKSFAYDSFGSSLTSLRLISHFDGDNLALLAAALGSTPNVEELTICGLCLAEEKTNEIVHGLSLVVAATSKTLESLTIGFFPGFETKSGDLKRLGTEIGKCSKVKEMYFPFINHLGSFSSSL